MKLPPQMSLDISGRRPLSSGNARMLNELAVELRPQLVKLIDQISSEQLNNMDWWVTPLASRNPFASNLFLNCCRLMLLEKLLELQQAPAEVWVDSPAMLKLAEKLASEHCVKLKVRVARLQYWHENFLRPLKSLLVSIYHSASQLACAKLIMPQQSVADSPLIVIDTFVYSSSIKNGVFYDRNFPSINEHLEPEERLRLRYFPTFYKIRNYPKIFLKLRSLRGSFLLKEDYLKLSDYFYAFGHGVRVRRIKIQPRLMFGRLPLNLMLCEELRRGWMWPSAIEGLLKFRAIARMSHANVQVGRALDWFENQDIDRGANAGFRRYYPNTEVVGYVGYAASQHYLCMYPSAEEMRARILPTRFAVMGSGFVNTMSEFCPDAIVEIAPALRYSAQPQKVQNGNASEVFSILVALPVIRAEALEVLATIVPLLAGFKEIQLAGRKIQFFIKPHPAGESMRNYDFGDFSNSSVIKWADESLDKLLGRADVLISTASSACFEALMMGVPVVVLGSRYGLTFVPIPLAIPQEQWKICYSWKEMQYAIEALHDESIEELESNSLATKLLRREYLEPVSRAGVRRFFLGVDDE